jgi:hypothetical protein
VCANASVCKCQAGWLVYMLTHIHHNHVNLKQTSTSPCFTTCTYAHSHEEWRESSTLMSGTIVHMHVSTCTHKHAHLCTHAHTRTLTHTHAHKHAHTRTLTHTRMHTHRVVCVTSPSVELEDTHTRTPIHTHTRMHTHRVVCVTSPSVELEVPAARLLSQTVPQYSTGSAQHDITHSMTMPTT